MNHRKALKFSKLLEDKMDGFGKKRMISREIRKKGLYRCHDDARATRVTCALGYR